jgi:hypothetical protein
MDFPSPSVCLLVFFIGIAICVFFIYFTMMNSNRCAKDAITTQIVGVSSSEETKLNTLMCNFFIKTSYNSCASGNFMNGWVNLCALNRVIKYGCRVLDFEIYSVGDMAVVSTSNSAKNNEKGTFNSIPISLALEAVRNNAISRGRSSETCPNPNDPLFLHFRIKTSNEKIKEEVAKAIVAQFGTVLLSPDYNLLNNKTNLCNTLKLSDLMGKVIIIVDKMESLETSILGEVTNIVGNGPYFHSWRYNDVAFSPDEGIADFNNSGNMTFCSPNLSFYPTNYSSVLTMKFGVQMSALCFQNNDVHLKTYNSIFDEQKSAFIVKGTSYTPNQVAPVAATTTNDDIKSSLDNVNNTAIVGGTA